MLDSFDEHYTINIHPAKATNRGVKWYGPVASGLVNPSGMKMIQDNQLVAPAIVVLISTALCVMSGGRIVGHWLIQ